MKPISKKILFSINSLPALAILLFVLSLIFNTSFTNRSSVIKEVRVAGRYLQRQQKDFEALLKDTALINRLISGTESLEAFKKLAAKKYSFFLYSINSTGGSLMKFWNNHLITPSPVLLTEGDGEYFSRLSNGWYYTIKKTMVGTIHGSRLVSYAMIPVRSYFFIETDYLPRKFAFSHSADKRVRISEKITPFPVKSVSGKILFYLERKISGSQSYLNRFTIWLRLASVLLLFLFIHRLAEETSKRKGPWKGIGLLVLALVIFRLLTYFFPFIFHQRQFELFSPLIYGSNFIQRSLGDLLINAMLFCWIVLYAWTKLQHLDRIGAGFSLRKKWVFAFLSICILIGSAFILANLTRSLVSDSKISFDVTNFFGLNIYSVLGFAVLACLSLSFYYLSRILYRVIFPVFGERKILVYFIIGLTGLLYLSLRPGHSAVLFYIPVLVWLIAYTWLVNREELIIRRFRINIAGILSWIFIFSVSMAAVMLAENNKEEWEKRKSMAEKLVVQTDPSGEMLMSIAMQYLDNDFLRDNFPRFRLPDEGKALRDSIITENYSGYLDRYDTRLYVYDANDQGIYNEDPVTYDDLNIILNVQSKPAKKIEGLYYYETSYDRFNYITRREITDSANKKIGSFFIISNPKKFSRDALFPELFRQFKQPDPEHSPVYAYAVYVKQRLVSQPGNYPFAISLYADEIPKEGFHRQINGDFDELWYRVGNDKLVVIARKKDTFLQAITLFSYIFCSFLFLVVFVQLVSLVVKTSFNRKALRKLLQLNIRSQVHSTIIFISFFSFLIIGIATISFFITRYNRNNSDKLSRTMKIMVNEMQKRLSDQQTFDDVLKIYDSVANTGLRNLVKEVSDIHGVDVNVYDLDGNLQVSSQDNVYSNGVLSKKMEPGAYYHLNRLRQVQHSKEEKIGNISYLSIYSPVRDDSGYVYAYLNIPYFTSKPELRQEISNFLVTIINLNAFIFLIAGLIALFITNRITGSFSIISNRMRDVNLGKMNEPIAWNRDDEIGELVKEYNKMVTKLGESAAALAKSEREGAWREMARQVAHEIKNPLTPMKLSIQYLQKAVDSNQPNVKELSGSVARTLVEQIDHLSKIAADFSQFANIGNTHVEVFDLHDVIVSLKDLYAPNPRIVITWKPVPEKIMVAADKTQMNRLFTNLFANAAEACQGNEICQIEVGEMITDGMIRISIKDNGEGIPPEMQEKIFIPNFTTKSSGTGLGLAMCKGIVEQAKGKIWFETEPGKGTTFYIQLFLSA